MPGVADGITYEGNTDVGILPVQFFTPPRDMAFACFFCMCTTQLLSETVACDVNNKVGEVLKANPPPPLLARGQHL